MKSKESIFLIGTLFLAIATLLVLISFSHAGACEITYDSWLDHDTLYASWDHLWFSWFGYLDPLPDDYFESCAFQWWGEPVFIGEN